MDLSDEHHFKNSLKKKATSNITIDSNFIQNTS